MKKDLLTRYAEGEREFSCADLRGAALDGAALTGADLSDADLSGADLRYADLRYADLRGARLRDAYLRGADLSGADLRGADLSGAYPRDAYLRDADLSGADLRDADLSGAYLHGADLSGVRLSGAKLPPAPSVACLDAQIAAHIDSLSMDTWHCGTTHCRAGWAITLAGEEGAKLEADIGPCAAGALIYQMSEGYVPDFFASTEKARADILQRVARQKTPIDN